MRKLDWILVFLGAFFFLCSWIVCDFLWDNKAENWHNGALCFEGEANPYKILWSKTRWIFFGSERSVWLALFLLFPTPAIVRPIFWVLFDFALGNFIDRLFFDYQTYNWNDGVIWLFAINHLFKFYLPKQYAYFALFVEQYILVPFLFITKPMIKLFLWICRRVKPKNKCSNNG